MEEAFTKLKQVTGVKNVEEMHEKFSNQKSNKLQLELEVKDAEHRLAGAKKTLSKLEAQFQELKSSGNGLQELNRDNINRLEELFNEAKNDQKTIKAEADRIAAVLVSIHDFISCFNSCNALSYIVGSVTRCCRIIPTYTTIPISY
jgi:predicted  nucleic acid-binding Zn-ribbon protein